MTLDDVGEAAREICSADKDHLDCRSVRARREQVKQWRLQRVGVLGAGGRMGRTVCQAVIEDPDMELVAAIDPEFAGIDLRQVTGVESAGIQIAKRARRELERANAEVVVDFTVADAAAREHAVVRIDTGMHAVVGTTGLSPEELAELEDSVRSLDRELRRGRELRDRRRPDGPLRRARRAVHGRSRDHRAAPRQQGRRTFGDLPSHREADRRARVQRSTGSAVLGRPDDDHTRRGTRGGRGSGRTAGSTRFGFRASSPTTRSSSVRSVRSLTIRHDAYDRTSFMPGVLLAVRAGSRIPKASPSGSDRSSVSESSESILPVQDVVSPRQRILEATYACIARWGIFKTTVEDAAREAGMSRATVYRHFPGGREELMARRSSGRSSASSAVSTTSCTRHRLW